MSGKKFLTIGILVSTIIFSYLQLAGTGDKSDHPNYSILNVQAEKTYKAALPLSFSVISDIHGNTVKLEKAIKDLYSINPNTDAMVLNGDIVDQGLDKYYSQIGSCLDRNKAFLPAIIIKNIGNHEFFNYSKKANSPAMVKEYITRYLVFSNNERVYHDVWVKGYHFISLGTEECNTYALGNTQAFISEEQQKWLREKLAEKYQPGKFIFVFLHQHVANNVMEIISKASDIKQYNEIKDILAKYPEVILFTSHTHSYLSSENLVCLYTPFTAIHTGAINNPILYDGKRKKIDVNKSQGLYVEVKGDKITVRGRNIDNSSWVQGGIYSRGQ